MDGVPMVTAGRSQVVLELRNTAQQEDHRQRLATSLQRIFDRAVHTQRLYLDIILADLYHILGMLRTAGVLPILKELHLKLPRIREQPEGPIVLWDNLKESMTRRAEQGYPIETLQLYPVTQTFKGSRETLIRETYEDWLAEAAEEQIEGVPHVVFHPVDSFPNMLH